MAAGAGTFGTAVPHLVWQRVAEGSETLPQARSGHVAATLPASHRHDVLVFGGYIEDANKARQAANDSWAFSSATGTWTQLATKGTPPRARIAAQGAVVGGLFWLICGWDPGFNRDGGQILSDVWTLDLETLEWRQRTVQGEEMQPTSRAQAVVVGEAIYLHTHRCVDHILRLDVSEPDAPVLERIPVPAPEGAPVSRGLHSVTAAGDSLFLFAGAPKDGPMLGDLWRLPLDHPAWAEVDPDGQVPHVRCSHGAAAVGPFVFFHGGSYYKDDGTGLQPLNDFFVLNTSPEENPRWEYPRVLEDGPHPSPRNAATLTALADGRLLLFGGWNPFQESYNDTYLMDVSQYADISRTAPLERGDD